MKLLKSHKDIVLYYSIFNRIPKYANNGTIHILMLILNYFIYLYLYIFFIIYFNIIYTPLQPILNT